jgi:cell pole-organizing protein PopZ
MSAQPKPNEPSMEEILASIRRIIADDEVKPAEAPPPDNADDDLKALLAGAAAAPDTTVDQVDEDVLDLGSEASLLVEPPPEATASQPDSSDIDFLEASPAAPALVAVEPEPAPPPVFVPPPVQSAPEPAAQPAFDMAQLLSDQASSSVTSAFGQLAHTVLSNNARTLEDLVKDMLRPMLKSWLDDNLPTMVERLVRAEIERVARGGRS